MTGRRAQQRRWSLLSRHIDDGVPLTALAQESGVSLRTLQRWNAAYQVGGPAALARAERSDKGARRLPGEMVTLIEGLALVKPRNSLATITRTVAVVAQTRGWPPAHYWVVRDIVAAIPDELMTLAHSGPVGWRDKYELVWRFQADRPNDLWQADHTELDILVRDQSQRPARPWLTSVLDDRSRAICGYRVFLGAPSTLNTGLALRQAIWVKEDTRWPMCGIPDRLYVDHGSDFTSHQLRQIGHDLRIEITYSTIARPQGRGKVERFLGR